MIAWTAQDLLLAAALAGHVVARNADGEEPPRTHLEVKKRVEAAALDLLRLIRNDRLQLVINDGLDVNAEPGVWVLMKFWDGDVVDVPIEDLEPFLPPGLVLIPTDEDAS